MTNKILFSVFGVCLAMSLAITWFRVFVVQDYPIFLEEESSQEELGETIIESESGEESSPSEEPEAESSLGDDNPIEKIVQE